MPRLWLQFVRWVVALCAGIVLALMALHHFLRRLARRF